MNKPLFTVTEVAQIFSKSKQTIHNWISAGRFDNVMMVGPGDGDFALLPAASVNKVREEVAETLIRQLTQLGYQVTTG